MTFVIGLALIGLCFWFKEKKEIKTIKSTSDHNTEVGKVTALKNGKVLYRVSKTFLHCSSCQILTSSGVRMDNIKENCVNEENEVCGYKCL